MREESHLNEMRDAIRGDFERLERRRGGQALLQPAPAPNHRAEREGEHIAPPPRSRLARLLGR